MTDFKNPIIFIEFAQNEAVQMALCAETNASGEPTGVAMFLKKHASAVPTRTTDFVLKDLFKTQFSKSGKPDTYFLQLRPLTQHMTVLHRKQSGKFVTQYAFEATKQLGVVSKVRVNASAKPLKLEFEVFATYRASKDAAVLDLRETILCPPEFTKQLYDFFMGN
jgi:hypothetical protein